MIKKKKCAKSSNVRQQTTLDNIHSRLSYSNRRTLGDKPLLCERRKKHRMKIFHSKCLRQIDARERSEEKTELNEKKTRREKNVPVNDLIVH